MTRSTRILTLIPWLLAVLTPEPIHTQDVVISELLAGNAGGLEDEDGDTPDWIELQNQSAATLDLDGWFLTDRPTDLQRWRFPSVALPPGEYLVVFASGKNRAEDASELHASFSLGSDGEYLALVRPDGVTVEFEYAPSYPPQRDNVSYGISQEAARRLLVEPGDTVSLRVPSGADSGTEWTEVDFDDSAWQPGSIGVGFDAAKRPPPPLERVNVAPDGIAVQSTTGYGGLASLAIDGNTSGSYGDRTITHTATGDPQPWWQLTLDQTRVVESISIWNRVDCCSRRLSNFRVSLRDAEAEIVFSEDFFTDGVGFPARVLDMELPETANVATLRVDLLGSNAEGERYLSLAEVQVFALVEAAAGDVNVARDKSTSQSTTGYGGLAARAVDGNTDGIYSNGSITHTNTGDPEPAWRVDLGDTYTLGRIVLWNRVDCCAHRLSNFRVSVLDDREGMVTQSDHFTDRGFPGQRDYEVLLPLGTPGRFVEVAKLGPDGAGENYLSLAEVEVFHEDLSFHRLIRSDLKSEMLGISPSLHLRVAFEPDPAFSIDALRLRMMYDDGFVAYLNGAEIARRNAPLSPDGDASATAERAEAEALVFEDIDVTEHADLVRPGSNVLSIHGLNLSATDDDFLIVPELVAFSFDRVELLHFLEPTPGAPNDRPGVAGFVADTAFDHDRGFYDAPFDVSISTVTEGAEIVYTLDGSEPSERNGNVYTGPLSIDTTSVLRAAAFKAGFAPTNVDTHTYLFLDDVIASSVMDRSITQSAVYAPQMRAALTDLPSISITTSRTINGNSEVPGSIEMIHPDGSSSFQENAGVRYFGGAFTNFAKKNFRLYFRSQYGARRLRFPLFSGHERRVPAVEEFDQLELRSGSHDMNQRGFYMSNRFTDDTMLDMGNLNPHGRFVHLYLDGVYWGQYHLRERWNADMLSRYLGGDKEDYEAINGNWNVGGWADPGTPYDGDGSAWARIKSLRGDYESVRQYLDVPHYVDYMLMFFFGNSEDEYRCVGPTTEGSGFKFFLNDADGFTRSTGNRTGMNSPGRRNGDGPGSIFSTLLAEGHPDYHTLLADRIHEHFFNDGAMTPARTRSRLLERCDEVERAFIAEAARWGYRSPTSWQGAKNAYVNGVLPSRTAAVINQFRAAGFYAPVTAPRFNRHGGAIVAGFRLTMSAPSGAVYFTTDGTDPRDPGGSLSPTATAYNAPVVLEQTTRVRARARSAAGQWSALVDTLFYTDTPLRLTEIQYHPLAGPQDAPYRPNDYEFLELRNVGDEPLELAGVRVTHGVEFDFTAGAVTRLEPGETVVLVENVDAFASRYDLARILVAGEYGGRLENAGERIVIVGRLGEPIHDFTFDDAWHPSTDGDGASLVIVDDHADTDDWGRAEGWRASHFALGSPGFEERDDNGDGGWQRPGDLNQDSRVDISDAVLLLRVLFNASPNASPCGGGAIGEAANVALVDSNGDAAVDTSDAIHLLGYLFRGGPAPVRGSQCLRLAACPDACTP